MSFTDSKNYGWIVVLVSAISMAMIYSARHTFSIFFPPILDEFGWSRASTASIFSLTVLTYGFVSLFAGTLGARYSPKLLMCTGLVFTCGATAACSLANAVWHFYLIYGVLVPVGMSFCGWPLLVPAVANWFTKRRGLAISWAQTGSGLSFSVGLIVEPVIAEYGWRTAYVVQAIIILVAILPLYLFFFRYRPAPGQIPDDETDLAIGKPNQPPADWTMSQLMRSKHIWLMCAAFFCYWGVSIYLLLAHQIKFAQDVGYSAAFAASIFAIFGAMSVVGMLSAGISDLIGRETTAGISTVLGVISILAMLMIDDASQPWLMYVYSICQGLAAGLITPTVFSGAADIYRGRFYGTATGIILLGLGCGGAIGPWLGGRIYDLSHSYHDAFLLALVCQALGFGFFYLAAPRKAQAIRARQLG
jgi:MFS family permease